jgi:hypothetical protein
MPIATLSAGGAYPILEDVVYALPPKRCFVQSTVAIEASVDNSTWAALTGANTTGIQTAARFIRCTTAAAVVSVVTD